MHKNVFITGTSTDIGKTFVSAMILSAAWSHHFPAHYFKPLQTGSEYDCVTIKKLTNLADQHILQPVFQFDAPQTPYRAALLENKKINLDAVTQYWQSLNKSHCLVEGAGGFLSPITETATIRDLALALDLPLIIVATTKLGTLNHTLLTLEAAQSAHIPVKGIILSGPEDPGLTDTLNKFISVPILAEVPFINNMADFKPMATEIFSPTVLQRIFA